MHVEDSEGLRWYLLALCMVILYQVLEEVHSFLGLNLIYFDQVLQSKERSRVQYGDAIVCLKNFCGLMSYDEAELMLCKKKNVYSVINTYVGVNTTFPRLERKTRPVKTTFV